MRRFRHWIPALLYASFLFYLSHQSSPPGGGLLPDYVAHFAAYGFFSWTLILAVTGTFSLSLTSGRLLKVWLIAFLYALSDEFHQSFVPGRDPSLPDIAADLIGTFSFSLLVLWGWGWKEKAGAGKGA